MYVHMQTKLYKYTQNIDVSLHSDISFCDPTQRQSVINGENRKCLLQVCHQN